MEKECESEIRATTKRSAKTVHFSFWCFVSVFFMIKDPPHSRLYYAVRESLDQIRSQNSSIPKDEKRNKIADIDKQPESQSTNEYSPEQLRLYHVKNEPDYTESPLFARLQKQDETIERLNRQVRQLRTENRVLLDRNEEYIAEMHKKNVLNDQKLEEIEQVYSKRLENVQNNYEEECQQTERYRRTTEQQERELRELQFHVNDLQRELAQAKAMIATLQSVSEPALQPGPAREAVREHAQRLHGDRVFAYADESGHKVMDADLESDTDAKVEPRIEQEDDTMALLRGIEPEANNDDEISSTTEALLRAS